MAASSSSSSQRGELLSKDVVEELFRFVENAEKRKPPGDSKKAPNSKILHPNSGGHLFNAIVTLSPALDAAVIFDTLPDASAQLKIFENAVKNAQFAYIPERANKRSIYMTGFNTHGIPIRSSGKTTLPSEPMTDEFRRFCMELLLNLRNHIPHLSVFRKQVWNAVDVYEPVSAIVEFIVAESVGETYTKHSGVMNFSQLDFVEPEHAGDTDLSAVVLFGQPRIFDVKPVFTPKDLSAYHSYSLSSGSVLYLLGKNVRTYYTCSVKTTSATIGSSCLVTVRFRPKSGAATQAPLRTDVKTIRTNSKNPLVLKEFADKEGPSFLVVHRGVAHHAETYSSSELNTPDEISELSTETMHKLDMPTRRSLVKYLVDNYDSNDKLENERLAKKIPAEVIVDSKESKLTGIYSFTSVADQIAKLPEVLSALYQVHHVELGSSKGFDVQEFNTLVLPEKLVLQTDTQQQPPTRRRVASLSQQPQDLTPERFVFLGVDYYVDKGDC